MISRIFSPARRGVGGLTPYILFLAAVCFTGVGLILSAGFNLTQPTNAQSMGTVPSMETAAFPVTEVNGEYQSPFVAVVEKVQDAVVHVSARGRSSEAQRWHPGMDFSSSSGSGFFFRKDGYVLTNNHVVEGADRLWVTTASGYRYEAQLVGTDPGTDLAVVKVDVEHDSIVVIPFGNSDELKVGDWAIAIGNPFPQQGLDRTVTVGVISAKGRTNLNFGMETPTYQNYIQTDASINPGNSGGPLLNLRGECIGVNAAISSPTGVSVGIGFAIPINLARSVVPDLIESGKVRRGWLGVQLGQLTESEARRQGLDAVRGVKIDSVFAGSPAARAGLLPGDIVLSVSGQPVDNGSQLSVQVSQAKDGDNVPMEVVRDGRRFTVTAVVGDRDAFLAALDGQGQSQPTAPSDDFDASVWMGMELITFTPEVAEALDIEFVEGVYVRRVFPGSPAYNSSISRGTVILQVDNQTVKSIEDITRVDESVVGNDEQVPLIVIEPDGTIARKILRQ